jgi:hypothetical protein
MLKIRGISNAENLLMGVNRFGHCLTICITCAGNQLCPKPDAAIPRQVDAMVMAALSLSLYISYGKGCHLFHDGGGLWMLSSACDSHKLYAENLL